MRSIRGAHAHATGILGDAQGSMCELHKKKLYTLISVQPNSFLSKEICFALLIIKFIINFFYCQNTRYLTLPILQEGCLLHASLLGFSTYMIFDWNILLEINLLGWL